MKLTLESLQNLAIALGASLLIILAGCNSTPTATNTSPETAVSPIEQVGATPTSETAADKIAKVTLTSTADPTVEMGDVSLTETETGLLVEASLKNVPAGKHGFHIHQTGSCEDGGKAAGGHFNPDDTPHGYLPKDGLENAHAGDLGNIEISEEGTGSLSLTVAGLTLDEAQYGIAGRGIILHAQEDDFGQPTGNAGGRIGCGVIQ